MRKMRLPGAAAAAICLFIAANIPRINEAVCFFVFQARDLARASRLVGGEMIFFGPEMTGGGALPGPFYYFLLAPALAISDSWSAAWIWLVILTFAAAWAAYCFFARYFSPGAAVVFLAAFGLSAHTHRFLMLFLNVSYALAFAVGILICISVSFGGGRGRAAGWALVAAVLLLSLGIQLHFSLAVFAPVIAWLAVMRDGPAPPRRFWWLASVALLLPLAPFAYWCLSKLSGEAPGQHFFHAGSAANAPGSLLLMTDYILSKPVMQIGGEVLARLLEVVPLAFFPLGAAWIVSRRHAAPAGGGIWSAAAATFCIGFVPFSYWFFATIGMRYGLPFFVASVFLTAMLFETVVFGPTLLVTRYTRLASATLVIALCALAWERPAGLTPALMARMGFAFAAGAAAAFYLDRTRYRSRGALTAMILTLALTAVHFGVCAAGMLNVEPLLMPRQAHWRKIWRQIYMNTGWSFEEAIQRIYFVDHHLEQDARLMYEDVLREIGQREKPADPPDGYIVAFHKTADGLDPAGIKRWLLTRNIHQDVRAALESGQLSIGRVRGQMLIAPYRVAETGPLPRHFHDYGQAYFRPPAQARLDEVPGTDGAVIAADGAFVFKWNECPQKDAYCTAGAIVRIERGKARVQVVGSPLSQVSPWISPDWTQQWLEPYLSIRCGSRSHRLPLASSIGYGRENAGDKVHVLLWGNNSIVAPFTREIGLPCANPAEVGVGREGSVVETLYELVRLPRQSLTLKSAGN